jgi:putative ATPase
VRGLGPLKLIVEASALERIAAYSSGDARGAYNVLEVAATLALEAGSPTPASATAAVAGPPGASGGVITAAIVQSALQKRVLLYDKSGEEHYNLISALHKSVRNSDANAALYWLGRMLEAGEDPLYIARRLVRMAVEDIGLADPHALQLTVAARDAVDFIGLPEGNLALAEAAVYLALAPKSNALYTAYGSVQRDVEQTAAEPVPLHLRNAPTSLMKNLGYGAGYQYAHSLDDKVADMQCLPDNLKDRVYYVPTSEGVEKRIQERMQMLREKLAAAKKKRHTE